VLRSRIIFIRLHSVCGSDPFEVSRSDILENPDLDPGSVSDLRLYEFPLTENVDGKNYFSLLVLSDLTRSDPDPVNISGFEKNGPDPTKRSGSGSPTMRLWIKI
jgi:hypothetical protein